MPINEPTWAERENQLQLWTEFLKAALTGAAGFPVTMTGEWRPDYLVTEAEAIADAAVRRVELRARRLLESGEVYWKPGAYDGDPPETAVAEKEKSE